MLDSNLSQDTICKRDAMRNGAGIMWWACANDRAEWNPTDNKNNPGAPIRTLLVEWGSPHGKPTGAGAEWVLWKVEKLLEESQLSHLMLGVMIVKIIQFSKVTQEPRWSILFSTTDAMDYARRALETEEQLKPEVMHKNMVTPRKCGIC